MSYEHNLSVSLQFYVMISTLNHVINVYEIQYFDLWRLQTSWTTGFRCWHLQCLWDKDASYFSRILNFFGSNTGPACQGVPGLSPASPIVNPGLHDRPVANNGVLRVSRARGQSQFWRPHSDLSWQHRCEEWVGN